MGQDIKEIQRAIEDVEPHSKVVEPGGEEDRCRLPPLWNFVVTRTSMDQHGTLQRRVPAWAAVIVVEPDGGEEMGHCGLPQGVAGQAEECRLLLVRQLATNLSLVGGTSEPESAGYRLLVGRFCHGSRCTQRQAQTQMVVFSWIY